MLLVHGGRDHCRTWDWVAQAFREDYHVIAPDLRGHGDSQWVIGAQYAIIDYVYDMATLIDQKQLQPLTIVGHSLGGNVSLLYSGVFPANVKRLVSVEGWGPPPDAIPAPAPASRRSSAWANGSTCCATWPAATRGPTRRSTPPCAACATPTPISRRTRPAT